MPTPDQLPQPPAGPDRPPREADTAVLVLGSSIAPDDIPGLCEQLRAMLRGSSAPEAVCDVGALTEPDAVAVDALARLQLTARRLGRRLVLRRASDRLSDLLQLTGLREAVPVRPERWSRVGGVGAQVGAFGAGLLQHLARLV